MFFTKLLLFFWLSIGILPLLNIPSAVAQVQSANPQTFPRKRPAPPKRVPPNKVQPGGGLDFAQQSCTDSTSSLVALVPIENPVTTTKPNPSFLFYIPDRATAISHGEFSLLSADDKYRIYQASVSLEDTPGIIKIDLPNIAPHTLEEGKIYHWYFKIYCRNQSNSPISLNVDGWIERVTLTQARETKIESASPDVWYDSVTRVAESLLDSPQNLELYDRWLKLLHHIDLEHLTKAPLVDAFQVSKPTKHEDENGLAGR